METSVVQLELLSLASVVRRAWERAARRPPPGEGAAAAAAAETRERARVAAFAASPGGAFAVAATAFVPQEMSSYRAIE